MSENPIQSENLQPPAAVEPVPAEPAPPIHEPEKTSFVNELLWLGLGTVLPCGSITFYKKASRRPLGYALLFFLLFSLVLAALSSAKFSRGVTTAIGDLEKGLASIVLPEVTIRNGIATATGPQPYTFYPEQGMILAIDTTGKITEDDLAGYSDGFLMTRDSLVVLNSGQIQSIPLYELQQAFQQDPLVINKANLLQWATLAMGFVKTGAFIAIWLWNLFGRLLIILLAGLLLWGIASLIKPGAPFSAILITGIYSYVPAVYFNFILGQANAQIPFALTFVHVLIWIAALLFVFEVLGRNLLTFERTLRPWRALIGLPMLILMPLQYLLAWETDTAWSVLAWGICLLALAGVGVRGLWNAQVPES